jgi:hypothetical protein
MVFEGRPGKGNTEAFETTAIVPDRFPRRVVCAYSM